MDDYQVARLALDAVRTAARLAQQEQRRRERNRRQAVAKNDSRGGGTEGAGELRRQPEFEMPSNADGEIPDDFLPRM
jgi:hypothetical protein